MPRRNRSTPENNIDLNLTYERTLGSLGGIRAEGSAEVNLESALSLKNNRFSGGVDFAERTANLSTEIGLGKKLNGSLESSVKLNERGGIDLIGGGIGVSIAGFGGGLSADNKGNAAISAEAFGGKVEVARDASGAVALQICYGIGIAEFCTTFARDTGDPQNEGSLKLELGIKPGAGSSRPQKPKAPTETPKRPESRARRERPKPERPKPERPVKPHEDKQPNPPKKPIPKPKADIRKKPEPISLKKKPPIDLTKQPLKPPKKPPKPPLKPPKPPLKPKEPSPEPKPINLKKPAPAPKPPKIPRPNPSPSPKTPRPSRPKPPPSPVGCKDGKWVILSGQHRGPSETEGAKPVAESLKIDHAWRVRASDKWYGTGLPDGLGQTWRDRDRQKANEDFGSPKAADGWVSTPKEFENFEFWGAYAWSPNSNPKATEWGPDDPIHRDVCRVRWSWKQDYYDYKLDGPWKGDESGIRWGSSTPWYGGAYDIEYQILSTKPLPPCRGEQLQPSDKITEEPDKPVLKPAKPRPKPPKPNPLPRLPNKPTKPEKPMDKNCCKKIDEIYKYLGIDKLKKNKFPVAKQFLAPGATGTEDCEDYYQLNQALFRMLANGLILNPTASPHGNTWQTVNATAWAGQVYEMVAEAISNGDSTQKFEIVMAMQVTQLLTIIAEQTRKIEFISEVIGINPHFDTEEIPACFTIYEKHKGFGEKQSNKIDTTKAKTDTEVEEILTKMLRPSKIPITKWVMKEDSRSIVKIITEG